MAKVVLEGEIEILNKAIKLIHNELKNVRSGTAKIIEKVAEEKPELVAKHLNKLIEALNFEEPQTKWMMIHVFGLCAKLQPQFAQDIFATATNYLSPGYGTVLRD